MHFQTLKHTETKHTRTASGHHHRNNSGSNLSNSTNVFLNGIKPTNLVVPKGTHSRNHSASNIEKSIEINDLKIKSFISQEFEHKHNTVEISSSPFGNKLIYPTNTNQEKKILIGSSHSVRGKLLTESKKEIDIKKEIPAIVVNTPIKKDEENIEKRERSFAHSRVSAPPHVLKITEAELIENEIKLRLRADSSTQKSIGSAIVTSNRTIPIVNSEDDSNINSSPVGELEKVMMETVPSIIPANPTNILSTESEAKLKKKIAYNNLSDLEKDKLDKKKFGTLANKIKSLTKNRPKSERSKEYKLNPYAPNASNKDKRRTVLVQLELNGHGEDFNEIMQGSGDVSTVTVQPANILPTIIEKKAKNFKEKYKIFAESEFFQPIITAVCTYFAFLIFTIYLLWNIM